MLNPIFFLLLGASYAFIHFEIEPIDMSKTKLTVTEKWFDNLLDHFRKYQLGTYKQRYWEMLDFFDSKSPKAILYFCGEGPGRFPNEKSLPVVAAQSVKAAVYSLEHRFYGKSQPTLNWTTDSLKYLSFEQGLADAAFFIESINAEFKTKYGSEAKWVIIGGSYAGAMSAWFRFKYPHLVAGSISSSGVVNAIDDFYNYERQVIIDLGKCKGDFVKQLREYQEYADSQLYNKDPVIRTKFLKMFNAEGMEVLDFEYYFADIPVAWIQGGKRDTLCEILEKIKTISGKDEQIKELAKEAIKIGHTVDGYKLVTLQNTTIDHTKNSRQWYYQVCTTFGWFQTPYVYNPIRSLTMNITYWRKYCSTIFPKMDFFPDVNLTNSYMSGMAITSFTSNTFFTQGSDDGWKWAGIIGNYDDGRNMAKERICDNCAHCVDLKPATDNDPEVLKETRENEIKAIRKWLS